MYVLRGPRSNDPNQMTQFRHKYTYYITYYWPCEPEEEKKEKWVFEVGQSDDSQVRRKPQIFGWDKPMPLQSGTCGYKKLS